jgi:hypothetical protein
MPPKRKSRPESSAMPAKKAKDKQNATNSLYYTLIR